MYTINKIVGYIVSPTGFSIVLVAAAVLARVLGRRRLARWAIVLALVNFWIWSTPWMTQWMGAALEAEFLVDGRAPSVESLPEADLIELHGGGMGIETNISAYAEMWSSADRVWHAARLWKARKAPKILVTSGSADLTTGPLLADLGVPKDAIIYDFGPRNTEEEAKSVATFFANYQSPTTNHHPRPKILVVTSAWHMKRTMLVYKRCAPGIEAIPAPCDFEYTFGAGRELGWMGVLPDPATFSGNSVAFHEWLGYWGYKLFR